MDSRVSTHGVGGGQSSAINVIQRSTSSTLHTSNVYKYHLVHLIVFYLGGKETPGDIILVLLLTGGCGKRRDAGLAVLDVI